MRLYTRCTTCHTEMQSPAQRPFVMLCVDEACKWCGTEQTDSEISHRYMYIAMTGPDYIDRHGNRWAAND